MSPFRSILLILIGGSLFAVSLTILIRLGSHFPGVAMFAILSAAGIYILYLVFKCLLKGVITINAKSEMSVYERHANPVGFWFYILLFLVLGFLFSGCAVYFLLATSTGK
jgi:hypothetical protein